MDGEAAASAATKEYNNVFPDIPQAVFEKLDAFQVMELAAEESLLGKVIIEKQSEDGGQLARVAEVYKKFGFDELRDKHGAGNYTLLITRRGRPGGNICKRDVRIHPDAIENSPKRMLTSQHAAFESPQREPSAPASPTYAQPAAPAPNPPSELEAMRAEIEKLREEKRELVAKHERDESERKIDALREDLRRVREEVLTRSEAQPPAKDETVSLLSELIKSLLAAKVEAPAPVNPLDMISSVMDLTERVEKRGKRNQQPSEESGFSWSKANQIVQGVVGGIAEAVVNRKPAQPQAQAQAQQLPAPQAQSPEHEQASEEEDVEDPLQPLNRTFLEALADAYADQAQPKEALKRGMHAVMAESNQEWAGQVFQIWEGWARVEMTEDAEKEFRVFVLSHWSVLKRAALAPFFSKKPVRQYVLDVFRVIRELGEGVAAQDEASIQFVQEMLAA